MANLQHVELTMNKHLPPPLKMKVERGRLVPATADDAERLDSYRVGSTVSVRFTADRMRPIERKYRAILGKVIKECKTPWSNAEAAHQALKLACGYVNVGRTMSGEFMQWPRSLVDFDDKEMEDYFESVLSLLHSMTGVDPETLRNETADVADDEPHNPETGELSPNNDSDAAPSLAGSDEGGAAPSPADAPSQEPAGESVPPAGSVIPPKEIEVLRRFAKSTLALAANPDTSGETMTKVVNRWINIDLVNVHSDEGRAAVKSIHGSVKAIMKGDASYEAAVEFHAEGLGCEPAELMPEATNG